MSRPEIRLRSSKSKATCPSGGKIEAQVVDRKPSRLPNEDGLDGSGIKRSRKQNGRQGVRLIFSGGFRTRSRFFHARVEEQAGLCEPKFPDPEPVVPRARQDQVSDRCGRQDRHLAPECAAVFAFSARPFNVGRPQAPGPVEIKASDAENLSPLPCPDGGSCPDRAAHDLIGKHPASH